MKSQSTCGKILDMALCPHCETESPEGAAFCAKCGAPMQSYAGQPYAGQAFPIKKKTPWGWIIAGIACFICICPAFLGAILFPVFAQARKSAESTAGLSNAKQVALGMVIYTGDYDDVFPDMSDSSAVAKLLDPYLKNPQLVTAAAGYEWNGALSRVSTARVNSPATAWVLHTRQPDETGKFDIGFVDGHVKRVPQEEFTQVTSAPTDTAPDTTPKATTP